MTAPVLKSATVSGVPVWIEVPRDGRMETQPSDRCFRFSKSGHAEWASLGDLSENGTRARWYGHCYRANEFIFA